MSKRKLPERGTQEWNKHCYGPLGEPDWHRHHDFVYDVVGYLIETPLTRSPGGEELKS
jgi:hypothetical protein